MDLQKELEEARKHRGKGMHGLCYCCEELDSYRAELTRRAQRQIGTSRVDPDSVKITFVTSIWKCKHCKVTHHEDPTKFPFDVYEFPFLETPKLWDGILTGVDGQVLSDEQLRVMIPVLEKYVKLMKDQLSFWEEQQYCSGAVRQKHKWEDIGGGIVTTYDTFPFCDDCASHWLPWAKYTPPDRDERWIILDKVAHLPYECDRVTVYILAPHLTKSQLGNQ